MHINYHYKDVIAELYLGADGKDKTPTQKGIFALAFNSPVIVMTQYSDSCPTGFNVTDSLGFDQVSADPAYIRKAGVEYICRSYTTWVRLNAEQKVNSNIGKNTVGLLSDTSTWMKNQLSGQQGIVGLGSKSEFFQALIQTYKPAQGDIDRIPVSWSLNPEDEAFIFDSRARLKGDSFIVNGFRSTGKQYGKSVVLINGIWHFPGMDFKMGSGWNATNKTVCIDPNADATVAVPSADLNKIVDIIQADICNGNKTSSCDYSKANISKMTNLEVSFESTSQFQPQVTLKGTDIIKAGANNDFYFQGISQNTAVSSVCSSDTIVLGRWFFTKAEITFWVSTKDPTDVLLSFSRIETSSSKIWIPLLILFLVLAIAMAVIGYFVWQKYWVKRKLESKYASNSADESSIGHNTF